MVIIMETPNWVYEELLDNKDADDYNRYQSYLRRTKKSSLSDHDLREIYGITDEVIRKFKGTNVTSNGTNTDEIFK